MNPRKALPGLLALPFLASVATAQRTVPVARPLSQDPQLKLPAPPPPVQAPLVRNVQGQKSVQQPAPKFAESEKNHASKLFPHDRLYFGNSSDGSPSVHGRTFKAFFTPGGASFVPYFGSKAATNHPLSFRIQSIDVAGESIAFEDSVGATLAGDSVRYARGGVTEVYDLRVDTMEQKFVFDSLPGGGELALRLGLSTDMSAVYDGGAIVFSSADGEVRYSAATVVDANGARVPAETVLDGQTITLRVPADFLATAAFPVTIAPVLALSNVNWGQTFDDFAPAVAWDETNQRYCTTCEETYSATDHDIIYVFSDTVGNFLAAGYVDNSIDYWANPDVANNNYANLFYCVAQVGDPAGGLRTIRGRTIDATSGAVGTDIEISVGTLGEDINPSVGGDPFGGTAAYFTVVWQRLYSPGVDEDILAQQVDQTGALLNGIIYIDNSGGTLDRNPHISKSCLSVGLHHVVWARWQTGSDRDVYAAELSWAGGINIGSTAVVTGGDTTAPQCSPVDGSSNWMLVYDYDFFTDHDVMAAYMTGVTVNTTSNMSVLEYYAVGSDLFQDQVHPAVDTDGSHFAYSYSESFASSATDYDIYITSFDVIGGLLRVSESHQNMAFDTSHEDFPRMCSHYGSGGSDNVMGINWSDDTNGGVNLGDVEAGVYATSDFTKICWAGFDGVMSCPCANNPASAGVGCDNSSSTGGAGIYGAGNASIASDSAYFTTYGEKPTATSIVAQGPGLIAAGTTFGQGIRCAGSAGGIGLKRLYTKVASGGSISAPGGGDPSLSARSASLGDPLSAGSVRYYYVYYRDPSVLGGCSAGSTFNSTDTTRILWRP